MSKQYKSQIRRRWGLPADYWMLLERCCGLRTVWSNDTYEALELWGLDTLVKGQEGYAYNPVEQKVPISYLRMCRGLRLPLCFCWNNCGQ